MYEEEDFGMQRRDDLGISLTSKKSVIPVKAIC